jgi:glycosyltransferase involved in cell wall biosynthesis
MAESGNGDRVSVIIPAFNAAGTIRETIESVQRQTHEDFEIIVVDDGSADGTLEIVRSMGAEIRLVQQSNVGPGTARNAGAAVATGAWLAFLDSDDLWKPEKLEKQLREAEVSNAELIYTNVIPIGSSSGLASLQHDPSRMPHGNVLAELQLDNFVTLSSVMISSEAFAALGGFCGPEHVEVAEDWDLWLRYAESGRHMSPCTEPLVLYRWRNGSLSHNVVRMHVGRLAVLSRHVESMGGKMTTSRINEALASAYACSAWSARRNRRWFSYIRFCIGSGWHGLASRIVK